MITFKLRALTFNNRICLLNVQGPALSASGSMLPFGAERIVFDEYFKIRVGEARISEPGD